MSNNAYDVPENVKNRLSGRLDEGDGVQLPFDTALFWVVNGDKRLQQVGGVPYYGGWAAEQVEFETFMQAQNLPIPDALQPTDFTGENGNYSAYTIRALAFAPVILRKRDVGEHSYREHLQLLGVSVVLQGNEKVVLGPTVLTAKGYQTMHIKNAFREWQKASGEALRVHANGLPSKLFYLPVGTFGDPPEVVQVGKGSRTSPITPIRPQIPSEITDQVLRGRYVGKEVAELMAEMHEQAEEWVEDWKNSEKQEKEAMPADPFMGADDLEDVPF